MRASANIKSPPTLLEISGAALPPARLADSVVVLIDAQRVYVDGRLPLPGVRPALREAARLLARARAAGTPVIHVVQHGRPGGAICDPNGPDVAIADEVAPRPGESIIIKALPNSFARTALDETLQRLGRKHLIVAGFMTHMCVSTTVRSALDHGYATTVVAAACATRDLPDGRGGVLPAAIVQRANLAALADRFATVVETADGIPD
jgi:nicotinamidase-related amidase